MIPEKTPETSQKTIKKKVTLRRSPGQLRPPARSTCSPGLPIVYLVGRGTIVSVGPLSLNPLETIRFCR